MKVVSILAVIAMHTQAFRDSSSALHILVDQGSRFAVPYFFFMAGFFWERRVARDPSELRLLSRYSRRLLVAFLCWSLIYILAPTDLEAFRNQGLAALVHVPAERLGNLLEHPVRTIFEGGRVHLWFLMGLLWAVGIATAVLKAGKTQLLMPVGVALYAAGLMFGSYAVTGVGQEFSFQTRNGPFFSTLFFAAGYSCSRRDRTVSLRLALWFVVAGFFLHMAEAFCLWRFFGVWPTRHNFLLGTIPFGLGAAFVALSWPGLGERTKIHRAGVYTLGVYAVHFLVVDLLKPIDRHVGHSLWEIAYPLLVYALSVSVVLLMAKSERLRPLVT